MIESEFNGLCLSNVLLAGILEQEMGRSTAWGEDEERGFLVSYARV